MIKKIQEIEISLNPGSESQIDLHIQWYPIQTLKCYLQNLIPLIMLVFTIAYNDQPVKMFQQFIHLKAMFPGYADIIEQTILE